MIVLLALVWVLVAVIHDALPAGCASRLVNLRSVKIKYAKEFGVRHVSQLPEPKRVGVGSSYFDE